MSHASGPRGGCRPFALAVFLICVGAANGALGAMEAEEGQTTTSPDREAAAGAVIRLAEEGPGIEIFDEDDPLFVHAWLRAQFRYSNPFDADPRTVDGIADPPGADFDLRRARIKMEGHLFDPRVGFYFEHELSGDRPLLDLR
ncbi:MAG: hypothetical protein P8172_16065, partial [Gammaproteobacteria bacterium]